MLEKTTAVRLLLRRIADRAHYPIGTAGAIKTGRIAVAATDIAALFKEVVQLAVIDPDQSVSWSAVSNELAYCLREVATLQAQTKGSELKQVDTDLAIALNSLESVIPAKAWKLAHDAKSIKPLDALNEDENYELARNAIIAACREVTKFKGSQRGDEERVNTVTATLPLHFQTAAVAARLVKDRDFRITLHDDMRLASDGMNYLDAFIRMPEQLKWNRLYAAAFDAENTARHALGMQPIARIYSGSMDPEDAAKVVAKTVKDGRVSGAWSKRPFATPEQAVLGLAASLDLLFDAQIAAVTRLASDLREPPPAKSQSWWQKLLEVAVKIVLSTVASGVASYLENAIKIRIDNVFAKRSGIPMGVFDVLPKGEKNQWLTETLGNSDIFRKVTADAAKDGFKEVIKSGGLFVYQMSLGNLLAGTKAAEPLNGFTQVQTGALMLQRYEARMMMIHLMSSLKQMDFDVLNAIALGISEEVSKRALELQYDASMIEWQNLKTRLIAGDAKRAHIPAGVRKPASNSPAAPRDVEGDAKKSWEAKVKKHPHHAHETMPEPLARDARLDDQEVSGAFEIKARVDAEGSRDAPERRTRTFAAVESLRMPGAEPRTLSHFRERSSYLADLPMHKHFDLRFTSYMNEHKVRVGVGPDRGLLLDGLGVHERRVLRLYAAGQPLSNSLYGDNSIDRIPEGPGIQLLVHMIDQILRTTNTRKVTK